MAQKQLGTAAFDDRDAITKSWVPATHVATEISANGVTDVSEAFGELISGLPSKAVLQLGAGTYYVPELRHVAPTGDLVVRGVPGKTRLLGDGVLTPSNRDADVMLSLVSGSIRLEDIIFENVGVVLAYKDLSELGDIEIYRCEFRNVGSPLMARYDPVTATARINAGKTMTFDNVRVRECQFIGCALGIWLQHDGGWDSVSIADNVFEDVGQAGCFVGYEYTANDGLGGVTALDRDVWQPGQGRVVVHGNIFRDIHRSTYTISNPGANGVVVNGQQAIISDNHIEDVTNDVVWDDCEGIYTKARYVSIHDNVLLNAGGSEAAIMCKGPEWDAETTIAAGSSGASLPQATINVASTEGFGVPFGSFSGAGGSGNIILVETSEGMQSVTFESKTATQLLGCSGGTGTMSTGGVVRGNANLFGGLSPVSTPNMIHHNTIVFTRTDVVQRGIGNMLGHCTVSDNLIVGATGQAINVFATTRVVNNIIRDHHGTTAITVSGTSSGGGSVVRGNSIINLDGSFAPSASPYIGIAVATMAGVEYRDMVIADNTIRNELTAAGALSAASAKLRAVSVNASDGTIRGITIRSNKARNVAVGINVSALGTVTELRDVDNDWVNEDGSTPTVSTSYATPRAFRSMDFTTTTLDGAGKVVVGYATATDAVNYLQIANSVAGQSPVLSAAGSDSTIDVTATPKGANGVFRIGGSGVAQVAHLNDTTHNARVLSLTGVANAVNFIRFDAAATGSQPYIRARGADSVISLNIMGFGPGAGVFVRDGNAAVVAEFSPGSGLPMVNRWKFGNSSTGVAVTASAVGTDTDIGINLVPKNNGKVQIGGIEATRRTPVVVTGTQTLGANGDYVVFLRSGAVVTLPTAENNTSAYWIVNEDTVDKTISTTSSQTINGQATLVLPPDDSIVLVSNGTNWRIF